MHYLFALVCDTISLFLHLEVLELSSWVKPEQVFGGVLVETESDSSLFLQMGDQEVNQG